MSGDRAQNGVSALEKLPAEAGSKETQEPARWGASRFPESLEAKPGQLLPLVRDTCHARAGLAASRGSRHRAAQGEIGL